MNETEIKQPMMVELIPNVWVRPEQVAAIWREEWSLAVQFVGASDPVGFDLSPPDERTPLREIVERLNPIRWEQPDPPPVSDGDTIEIRSMSGETHRVYIPPATGNVDAIRDAVEAAQREQR